MYVLICQITLLRDSLDISQEHGDSFSAFITICKININNLKRNHHMERNNFVNQAQGVEKGVREGVVVI
jgi:hypothetical protein